MVKPNDNSTDAGKASPNMSRRTFTKAAGVSAAALALAGTGGALAWFTGRDEKANKLSVADNLNVQVVEPAWDPEAARNVVPGQHIPKDPRIKNLHDAIPGYLFVEIRVPTAVVEIYDEATSTVLPAAKTQLFTWAEPTDWTQLQKFEDGTDVVYRYGWPNPIEAQGQTPPIFEEVVFANLAEVQGQEGAKRLTVTAYGIQSHGFSNCLDAWTAYKLQNGIGDGTPGTVSAVVVGTAAGNKLQFVQGEPSVGDELDGGEVLGVVPDVEHLPSGEKSPLVSDEHRNTIVEVVDTVPTAPENTTNWFKDMGKVTSIDLSGLDMSKVSDKGGMFDGCDSLCSVRTFYADEITECLPSEFAVGQDGITIGTAWAAAFGVKNTSGDTFIMGRGNVPDQIGDLYRTGPVFRGFESSFFAENNTSSADWRIYQKGSTSPIKTVRFIDIIRPVSTCRWFSKFGSLVSVENFNLLDLSRCTDARYMFSECMKFTEFNLDQFHVGAIKKMYGMLGALSGKNYNFSNWDLSSLESLGGILPSDTTVVDFSKTNFRALVGENYTSGAFPPSLIEVTLPGGFEFCADALKTQPVYMESSYANCRFRPTTSQWIKNDDSTHVYTPLQVCEEMKHLVDTGMSDSSVKWTRVDV